MLIQIERLQEDLNGEFLFAEGIILDVEAEAVSGGRSSVEIQEILFCRRPARVCRQTYCLSFFFLFVRDKTNKECGYFVVN